MPQHNRHPTICLKYFKFKKKWFLNYKIVKQGYQR